MGKRDTEALGHPPYYFQERFGDLVSEARAFAVAEDHDSISTLLSDWLPAIRRILTQALEDLADLDAVAKMGLRDLSGLREGWERATGTLILPRAFEEVSDLCFIATMECRASLTQLELLAPECEPFTLLVVMERAQAKLSDSLCAVETRLARICGRGSTTGHVDLSRRSLRARRLITRLRFRMASGERGAEDDHRKKIRSIGNSLTWLLGHDHFSDLLASERMSAKMLHRRILELLRDPDSSDDDARCLWQDATAFVELLKQINRRPELAHHDLETVVNLLSALTDADPRAPLPASIADLLGSLLGRDESLDEMLYADADIGRVLERLREIYRALEREGAVTGRKFQANRQPSAQGGRGHAPIGEIHA